MLPFDALRMRKPTAVIDPYTVLLLGFEGSNGATITSDESPTAKGLSQPFFGNAQIDTSQSKFGASSLFLDGAGDLVGFDDHNDWTFTGDFTIEAWVRFSNLTGFQTIVSQYDASGDKAWFLDFPGSANNVLRVCLSSNGSTDTFIQKSWAPTAASWHHVAVDRSGSTVRLYADGASLGSGIFSGSTSNEPEGVRVGSIWSGGNINFFKGWIDELRISNGIARYASDVGYTVPTAAFPRS